MIEAYLYAHNPTDRINTVNPYPSSATSLVVEDEIKSAAQVKNSVKYALFLAFYLSTSI